MIKIIKVNDEDKCLESLSYLLIDFRNEVALLKQRKLNYSLLKAQEELTEYFTSNYEVYTLLKDEKAVAYAVLKIFDETVWLEQLFVSKAERRSSFASQLLDIANNRARDYGKETAFVNVHPNNHKMISFLASNGYNVLNLLEVRKLYNRESIKTKIQVGDNKFLY